jgi:hypothetical protein
MDAPCAQQELLKSLHHAQFAPLEHHQHRVQERARSRAQRINIRLRLHPDFASTAIKDLRPPSAADLALPVEQAAPRQVLANRVSSALTAVIVMQALLSFVRVAPKDLFPHLHRAKQLAADVPMANPPPRPVPRSVLVVPLCQVPLLFPTQRHLDCAKPAPADTFQTPNRAPAPFALDQHGRMASLAILALLV